MEINSYLLRERLPVITLGAAGSVGTAAATVDIVSHVGVTASAPNLTFTLPAPTDGRSGRDFVVTNSGANTFNILGLSIASNQYGHFIWDQTEGAWQSPGLPTASAADFWRSGSLAGLTPDGATDVQDAIFRSGQVVIDTGTNGDGGLTLDDLRSRNSVQLSAGDNLVTDTNMTALGVDLNGRLRLSNAISIPDIRATNPNPQDYAAGFNHVFKQAVSIGMTGIPNLPTYVDLITTRLYAQGTDFSGGQVRQDVDLADGRQYFRMGTGATTWGPWQLESKPASNFDLQRLLMLNGQLFVSKTGEVFWNNRFITMTAGSRDQELSGYHDIAMPAAGAAIPVMDGTTRIVTGPTAGDVLAKGGIPLNAWETLWYRAPRQTGNGTVPANFRIAYYTNNGQPTNVNSLLGISAGDAGEWIMIASRDDQNHFHFGTGDSCTVMGYIGTSNADTESYFTALKSRVMGSGYFFSPAGNTSTPLAFGFTGTIRWINGGTSGYLSSNGYTDVSNRAVGLPVFVAGGAARAWRLMTAAEKPSWFGGMQRGNDPILAASSTVVDLNDNEMLCWIPDMAGGSNAGSWYIFPYAGINGVVPINALPVASKQVTGGQGTIQVLLGGVQYALKAGDSRYTSTNDYTDDAIRRNQNIQFNGIGYCRFTTAGFFAGAAANGNLGGGDGVMLSWVDNNLMYGISDGYANFGDQYTWINVPAVGAAIPVVCTNSNVTRVVQSIGGRRYIPLGTWEALYWIPPAYNSGNSSVDGDWVISYYGTGNQHLPPSAVMIAKMFSSPVGTGVTKTRVKFADGTYLQPGISVATATFAENDHAQGSGDWRAVVAAGQTGPAMTVPVPAVAGIANQGAAYKYLVNDQSPQGRFVLDGYIAVTADIADGAQIAFLPGAWTRSSGQLFPVVSRHAGNNTVPGLSMVSFNNVSIGGQSGVNVLLYGNSAGNTNAVKGGANGGSGVISLAGISFDMV